MTEIEIAELLQAWVSEAGRIKGVEILVSQNSPRVEPTVGVTWELSFPGSLSSVRLCRWAGVIPECESLAFPVPPPWLSDKPWDEEQKATFIRDVAAAVDRIRARV